MPLPHFTNIHNTTNTGGILYSVKFDVQINGRTFELIKFNFEFDYIEINYDLPDFPKSFNFKLNKYDRYGDLVYSVYYVGCKVKSHTRNTHSNHTRIDYNYNTATKVPFYNINGYERELKLKRILDE